MEQAFADILLGKDGHNVIPMHTFNRLEAQRKLTLTRHSFTGYMCVTVQIQGQRNTDTHLHSQHTSTA